ncbi:MAG: hypothetical protein CMK59_00560 [Proteobacteria bacterium]|nr:hypothetical protein [Pseudomonadota bacterium]
MLFERATVCSYCLSTLLMRISVIVPTLNRHEELLTLAQSLQEQTLLPDELVVVDAGTPSDLEQKLTEALKSSSISLSYTTSEAGTSLQRNVAMELAQGEFFFFFDDDVVPEPNYIEASMKCFDMKYNPPVGGVLGTFSSPYKMSTIRSTYAQIFRLTHTTPGDSAKLMSSGAVRWLIEPSEVVRVPVCSGGRVVFRRECFEHELWDDFLPGYTMSEDVEISYRIAKKWTLVQTPDAKIFHDKSENSRDRHAERLARLLFSRFYFFNKNLDKTPKHIGAFVWWNIGTIGLSLSSTIFGQQKASEIAKGMLKGYKLCLNELQKSK